MTIYKIKVMIWLAFIFLIIPLQDSHAASIAVKIDGIEKNFDAAPIIQNNRTLVPLRGIFESLGATVQWDSSTKTVISVKENKTVILTIGSSIAKINEVAYVIDAPALVKNNRTYVPLRFISEALGTTVQWDPTSKTVLLVSAKNQEKVDAQTSVRPVSVSAIQLGDSKKNVIDLIGNPKRTSLNEYGVHWEVYHQNYNNFFMVSYLNNKVSSLYTNSPLLKTAKGIEFGSTKTEVRQLYGKPIEYIQKGNTRYTLNDSDEYDTFDLEESYFTFFYDIHERNTVTSLQIIDKNLEAEKDGFYSLPSEELESGFEVILFDLTNAIRVRNNLSVLKWDDRAAKAARLHSEDMALHDYFSHYNLQKISPFERMEHEGITFSFASENLAMGQFSAIFAHEGLMNSEGHRKNILNQNAQFLGVGVEIDESKVPFFTQNFFAK